MKRLVAVLLPFLVVPVIALSVLSWSLAGRAEDRLLAARRQESGDLATTFASGLTGNLDALAGEFRQWANALPKGSFSSPPPDQGQTWTCVLDEQGRWWHPAVYAVHLLAHDATEPNSLLHNQALAEATSRERLGTTPDLAVEKYQALDRDTVPRNIRAKALLGLARSVRKQGDAGRSIELYRRLMTEFNEAVDETGLNLGAVAGLAFLRQIREEGAGDAARAAWRQYADSLLAGRFPMVWATLLENMTGALALAPGDGAEAEDVRRRKGLELAIARLQEMSSAAEVVTASPGVDRMRFHPVGERVLLVVPTELAGTRGWAVASFDLTWVKTRLMTPLVAQITSHRDVAAFIYDAMNRSIVGGPMSSSTASAELSLSRWGLPWTMVVGPANPDELTARAAYRHALMMGSIAFLILLMVLGTFIGYRMVRREVELSELKSRFVDNVSHELRTPVTSIKLFSELLSTHQVSDAQRQQDYFRLLVAESERLGRTVENMLDFSRIMANRMQIDLQPTEMGDFLTGLQRQWEVQGRPTGHHVRLHLGTHLPTCRIDPDAMSRAIANLVSNAIKYSPDDREVVVTAQRRDRMLSIAVRDRGLGIPSEDLPHIFERFYRARDRGGNHVQGTGLGLTIVKDTVERHGGTVRVDSHTPGGTVVELLLPVSEGEGEP